MPLSIHEDENEFSQHQRHLFEHSSSPIPPELEPRRRQPAEEYFSRVHERNKEKSHHRLNRQQNFDISNTLKTESVYAILKSDPDVRNEEKESWSNGDVIMDATKQRRSFSSMKKFGIAKNKQWYADGRQGLDENELDVLFGKSYPTYTRMSTGANLLQGLSNATKRTNISRLSDQSSKQSDSPLAEALNSSLSSATDLLSRRRTIGFPSQKDHSHQSPNSVRRRTIAPLATLDNSIQLRKSILRAKKLPSLSETDTKSEEEETDYSESLSITSSSSTSSSQPPRKLPKSSSVPASIYNLPSKPTCEEIQEEEEEGKQIEEEESSADEMKAVFRLRLLRSQKTENDNPNGKVTNSDERRKRISSVRSETTRKSFGSKILRRAKSVVSRQPKKQSLDGGEELHTSTFMKSFSRTRARSMFYEKKNSSSTEEQPTRPSTRNNISQSTNESLDFPDPFSDSSDVLSQAESSPEIEVSMQGDLYRKKLGHWVSSWAVLTADACFTLYKSREVYEELKHLTRQLRNENKEFYPSIIDTQNDTRAGIVLSINLKDGCEIENINQGKSKVTFCLVPHTYHAVPPGVAGTLSYEAGLWTDKPIQLMCKNNSEFLYWVKSFVQLNSPALSRSPRQVQGKKLLRAATITETNNQPGNGVKTRQQIERAKSTITSSKEIGSVGKFVDEKITAKNEKKHGSVVNQMASTKVKHSLNTSYETGKDISYIDEVDHPKRRYKLHHDKKKKNDVKLLDFKALEESQELTGSEDNLQSLELSLSPSIKSAELVFASHAFPACCSGDMKKISSNETCNCNAVDRCNEVDERPSAHLYRKDKETNKDKYTLSRAGKEHQETNIQTKRENNKETEEISGATHERPQNENASKEQTICGENDDNADDIFSRNKIHKASVAETNTNNDTNVAPTQTTSTPRISIKYEDEESVDYNASSEEEDYDDDEIKDKLHPTSPRSKSLLAVREGGKSNLKKNISLRQRVLRKLGAKNSLSSSTPNLNSPIVEQQLNAKHLEEISSSTPSSPVTKRKKQKSLDISYLSEKIDVTRSLSEGDIFNAVNSEDIAKLKKKSMRTFRNSRQLSRDNFIETYGVIPKKTTGIAYQPNLRQSMYEADQFLEYSQRNTQDDTESGRTGSHLDTSSDSAGSMTSSNDGMSSYSYGGNSRCRTTSSESYTPPATTPPKSQKTPSRKTRSTTSDESNEKDSSKETGRYSWLSSITPHFPKRSTAKVISGSSGVRHRAVFQIPATQLSSASHRGYLDRRNKKKQWERFWCVLQDSCLYFYNAPQSELTQDAVVLRGYDVVADVTNMHRTRFSFRLERNGSPTMYFSSDNHQNFLLWVGTLVKETSNVSFKKTDNEVLANSLKSSSSMPNIAQAANKSAAEHKTKDESAKMEKVSEEEIKRQKEQLLREVLSQQQKIIDEHAVLHQQNSNLSNPLAVLPVQKPQHPRLSKALVHEKYDKAKQDEEVKIRKTMTHLNRRRNSAQLKLDQVSRELAPKGGRKRRENPQQFADMENRLKQLQQRLHEVDLQIQEEQTKKKQDLEKIQQKRDLELMVVEQKESIEIIKRHHERTRQSKLRENENKTGLSAIEESTAASDSSSTSEDSSLADSGIRVTSTPRLEKRTTRVNDSQNTDNSVTFSSEGDDLKNVDEGGEFSDGRSFSASSADEVFGGDVSKSSLEKFNNNNNSIVKDSFSKRNEEINPLLLAEIDEFITFSQEKRKALS